MKNITLETIYNKVIDLQRDVNQIKKSLLEEPELREDFILRMKDIDQEKSLMVDDFGKRYGLK
ncbi:MAG: hypothetical protein WC581_14070 [Thermodesulfovibrionales bacterium]|jgi:hypothetical protein